MAAGSRSGSRRSRRGGFAYVLLLVAVAVLGLTAASSATVGSALARRAAESELLAVGLEFQQALYSYAGVPHGLAAAGALRGPRDLQELLKDPRVPGVRRHLRKLYADPLTGRSEWGLVRDSQGFIVGVYSLAAGTPLKRTGFDPRIAGFEEAGSYAQWVFGFAAAALPRPPAR